VSTRNIHHSTCSVIPEHILRHIAEHGDDDSRETIAATLHHTTQIVRDRAATLIYEPALARSPEKQRRVHDAANKTTLPGKLVMDERKKTLTRDVEAKEAFDGSGAMYDFLAKNFQRNSIDGRGMPLISTVHYGKHFDNAMWSGKQMIYGDGDGRLFTRFTVALDVIGHELTHGMTQSEAALEYHDQSGALNEHLSDVFGIMLKQWWLGLRPSESDWIIGAGLFAPGIKGKGVRSMKDPGTAYDDPLLGKDPQPDHMKNYVYGADDNGGVHVNSGILNRVFYLVAFELEDYAWKAAGRLWYRTLTESLFPKAGFQDFANATVAMAGSLFGENGYVQMIVRSAFSDVGLQVPLTLLKPARKWRNRPAAATRA
jgi:Zn-dependent metalloprotease